MGFRSFFELRFVFLLPLFWGGMCQVSRGQGNFKPGHHYVVIGAFSIQDNANRLAQRARALKLDARLEMNVNRNLFYVFVLSTGNKEAAVNEALRLRAASQFYDAWVYHGSFSGEATPTSPNVDINPVTQQTIPEVKEEVKPVVEVAAVPVAVQPVEVKKETTPPLPPLKAGEKRFFFSIFNASNGQPLEGEVNVIDVERARKSGTYKGNAPVAFVQPNKSGKILLECQVFGYRKVQRELDFANPTGEGIQVDEQNGVMIPFEQIRMLKGDIAIMYHVFFFNDAGVMRPESKFEVTNLLDMMKENPSYRIKIHGHTNGNASGKLIRMEEGSTSFFSLTGTKQGFGSAKELSEERAQTIKNYLISNGISADRMEVKAWGGKRPIHDKSSNRANENVRVEIEVL